jgi:hypothetical protein
MISLVQDVFLKPWTNPEKRRTRRLRLKINNFTKTQRNEYGQ